MRPELGENLLGANELAGGHINLRLLQGIVESRTISFIEPIARIQQQELNFCSVWQIRRLVHDDSTFSDVHFNSHVRKRSTGLAAQQVVEPST